MVNSMKKIIKLISIFIIGIVIGYYGCYTNSLKNIFMSYYKAFQVGVYTNLDAAIMNYIKYMLHYLKKKII